MRKQFLRILQTSWHHATCLERAFAFIHELGVAGAGVARRCSGVHYRRGNTIDQDAGPRNADYQPSRGARLPGPTGQAALRRADRVVPRRLSHFCAFSSHGRRALQFWELSAGFVDGVGSKSYFRAPRGLALSQDGAELYIADSLNNAIRKLTLATGFVKTLAGTGAAGARDGLMIPIWDGEEQCEVALLHSPVDVAVSPDGNLLAVADAGQSRVRLMNLESGTVIPVTDLTRIARSRRKRERLSFSG
jgi:WD40 repeat protein